MHQTIDDALRGLRLRKDAFVGLCDEFHTMRLKPSVGVFVIKDVEKSLHEFVAARVGIFQIFDLGERIGEVASAATRETHLRQHFLAFLEDRDVGRRMGFFCGNGGEKARCSATDDGHF